MNIRAITTGTLVVLNVPHGKLPAGSKGVCYEAGKSGRLSTASFLFQGGFEEDFSELQEEKLEEIGFCEDLANYKFHNLATLQADFKRGLFDSSFAQL